jgi:hypothetical protein
MPDQVTISTLKKTMWFTSQNLGTERCERADALSASACAYNISEKLFAASKPKSLNLQG